MRWRGRGAALFGIALIMSMAPIDIVAGPSTGVGGLITDAQTGLPLPEIEVGFFRLPDLTDLYRATTDASGTFARELKPGTYVGYFNVDQQEPRYLYEFWDDRREQADADEIIVREGELTILDVQLQLGGTIEGRVTNQLNQPVSEVFVWVRPEPFTLAGVRTTADGSYAIAGLPTDRYLVAFEPGSVYFDQYWDGARSEDGATLLEVREGETAAGIDAVLRAARGRVGTFVDDDGNEHEGAIEALAVRSITDGCAGEDEYCPHSLVTRGQMASFLVRAFGVPETGEDHFGGDGASIHEASINALAAAGVARGFEDGTFGPHAPMSRAQMASFLDRVLDLPETPIDYFVDDTASVHEAAINRLAERGVTRGCDPLQARFCPDEGLERDQMASLLARALELEPEVILDRMQWGLVGSWEGFVTTPWTSPYEVELELRDDGTYSGTSHGRDAVFYWGTDDAHPGKTYAVTDVDASFFGGGWVQVTWDSDSTDTVVLSRIVLNTDMDRLSFSGQRGSYGPIEFYLERVDE